jgi:putative flippase GtrA
LNLLRRLSRANLFAGFLLAGGIAAAVNFGSRFVFSEFVGYPMAVTLAYLVGMTTAFVLMKRQVFNARGAVPREALVFVGINLLALVQTLVVSVVLARYVLPMAGLGQHAEAIGHFVGVLVPVFTSYLGHKHWTFRSAG